MKGLGFRSLAAFSLVVALGCGSSEEAPADDDLKTTDFNTGERDLTAYVSGSVATGYLYPTRTVPQVRTAEAETTVNWKATETATVVLLPPSTFAYASLSVNVFQSNQFDATDGNQLVVCFIRANRRGSCHLSDTGNGKGSYVAVKVKATDNYRWVAVGRASVLPDAPRDKNPRKAVTAQLDATWSKADRSPYSEAELPKAP